MHFLEYGYGRSRDRTKGRNGPCLSQWLKLLVETCRVDAGPLVEGEHTAHEIAQLPYVAGPAMSLQPIHEARIKHRHRTVCFHREFFGKVSGQERNVFHALA